MTQFPCIVCERDVTGRHQAVECDWCQRWQHRTCGTGISLPAYRDAVKMGSLTFVCLPCVENELPRTVGRETTSFIDNAREIHNIDSREMPVLELSIPQCEDGIDISGQTNREMPVLELSIPQCENSVDVSGQTNREMLELELSVDVFEQTTLIDNQEGTNSDSREMPVLEPSIAIFDQSTILDHQEVDSRETTFDSIVYVQASRMEIPDIEEDIQPVADSTALSFDHHHDDAEVALSFELQDDDVDMSSHTIATRDLSFDISNQEIDAVDVIVETSTNIGLTETVLEDQGRENKSSTVWRCTSRSKAVKCPVTLRQDGNVFVQTKEHVHQSVPDRELKLQVYSKAKNNGCSVVFQPAMDIAEEALLEHRGTENVAPPKKKLVKRAVNRARAKFRPTEPRSLDFEVDMDFINGEDFLVSDLRVGDQRHFIFSTSYQLALLKDARRWYVDGTFKVVGEPFRRHGQLFSIHAFITRNGLKKQVPLVFILMSRRTTVDYVKIFECLVDRMGGHSVEGLVADFESAVWQAARQVFPGLQLKGCAFHWRQAVWRKVQDLGLAETYRKRAGLHQFVRMVFGLQFLPAEHIRGAVEQLRTKASTESTRELVGYVEHQWMRNSVFHVEDWCVFRQEVRTNNNVEGWHNRLNGKARTSGLSFYRLVPVLRREAEITRMTVESGDLGRDNINRARRREAAISSLWDKYEAKDMKASVFLLRVSDLFAVRQ